MAINKREKNLLAERDKWIRASNSLEKAVTNFLNLDHPADEAYLERAHKAFMREVSAK
jgi:hypothetical protein